MPCSVHLRNGQIDGEIVIKFDAQESNKSESREKSPKIRNLEFQEPNQRRISSQSDFVGEENSLSFGVSVTRVTGPKRNASFEP